MTTARDAVMDAYRPCTISSPHAAAVLAALGIPPDATVDDVRAGFAALALLTAGVDRYQTTPVRVVKCEGGYQAYRPVYHGDCGDVCASPAAAVLALAAKLEAERERMDSELLVTETTGVGIADGPLIVTRADGVECYRIDEWFRRFGRPGVFHTILEDDR